MLAISLGDFVFLSFSALMLISAMLITLARNPIHSVLYLILVFCNGAGILLLLGIEFLGLLYIVVYVGAIAVLFLFVVMMLDIKILQLRDNFLYLPVGIFFIILLVGEVSIPLLGTTSYSFFWGELSQLTFLYSYLNIVVYGEVLYTYFFYLFILCGVVLLVAMFGSIVLTLVHRPGVRRQDLYGQITRDFKQTVFLR